MDAEEERPCSWDPEGWWQFDRESIENAKAICRTCPLMAVCADYAIVANEKEGVWGATDPEERVILRRRRFKNRQRQIKAAEKRAQNGL
jgi:hypothetical protein